jgi:tetratricopeptide (TPR) repeat protein
MENDAWMSINYRLNEENNIYIPHYTEHINQGIEKLALKDFGGAIDIFSRAIHIFPKYELAYILRGNAKFESLAHEAAAEDYHMALTLNPYNIHTKKMLLIAIYTINFHKGEGAVAEKFRRLIRIYDNKMEYFDLITGDSAADTYNALTPLNLPIEWRITIKSLITEENGPYKYANKYCV